MSSRTSTSHGNIVVIDNIFGVFGVSGAFGWGLGTFRFGNMGWSTSGPVLCFSLGWLEWQQFRILGLRIVRITGTAVGIILEALSLMNWSWYPYNRSHACHVMVT